MYEKQIIGKIGENLACKYLKGEGYIIIGRNFRCRQGEIDIIAKDVNGKELVFIEVKTRTGFQYGRPAEAVDSCKQKNIYKCAEYYVFRNYINNVPIRLDVIEVFIKNTKVRINHIKQAF